MVGENREEKGREEKTLLVVCEIPGTLTTTTTTTTTPGGWD